MRVLVTGGAGFIGSHLVERLIADGHRVTVLDDLSTGRRDRVPSDVTLHVADVVNVRQVTDVVTACRPDVIYHLAAQISVHYSVANPVADATTNILGTMNLLTVAAATGGRLILASTGGAMYGDGVVLPTPETCLPGTQALYGIAKYCAEQYLMLFNRLHAGRHIALRLGNVYGPRQDPHGEAGVVAIFCGHVARELLDVINAAAGTAIEPTFAPARAGEWRYGALDSAKAATELNWSPATSLAEGIRQTYQQLTQNS